MKKLFLFSVLALFLSAMGSCEKDECKGYSKKEYVWYIGLGDEEGATIEKQAHHFKISQIKRDFDSGIVSYVYL